MEHPSVLADERFFDVLLSSYLWSPVIILPISYAFIKYAVYITNLPFKFYWTYLCITSMGSTQYTGLIDDYIMLAICIGVGMLMKYLKFSRVSFLIGFILSYRLEASWVQFNSFGYGWEELVFRPLPTFMTLTVIALIWGLFFNKAKIDFV